MHLKASAWNIVKRQTGSIPVIAAACYEAANYFADVFQSIGYTGELCDPAGLFSTAYSTLTSCTSANPPQGTQSSSYPYIASPLSYCSTYISNLVASVYASSAAEASTSSLCSYYASISSSPAASLNLTCSQFSTSSTYQTPATSTPTILSTQAQTSATASAAAASSTPVHTHLSTGAIAGIAVGAVIAILLLLTFIIFFIWRHRRAAKTRRLTSLAATNDPGTSTEKAQLHSDSYQPKREELEGSKAPRKVRVVPGLSELEYTDLRDGRGEMAANEVAAPELNGRDKDGPRSTTDVSGSTVVQVASTEESRVDLNSDGR